MSRRESVGRLYAATQSASAPPSMQMVSVAVLPSRLPETSPTLRASDWDSATEVQRNNSVERTDSGRRKSLWKRASIASQRRQSTPIPKSDLPPFIWRQVPYDTWRRHYAKDKDGNYRGTHAPAEDCLLKPEDVAKWNFGGEDAGSIKDRWTRGKEVLPVYEEAQEEGIVPEYEVAYDGPPNGPVMGNEPVVGRAGSEGSVSDEQDRRLTLGGRTAEDIIKEAEEKGKKKVGWKKLLQRGVEWGSSGGVRAI